MQKRWMPSVLLILSMTCVAAGQPLSISGLAGARFRVADLSKAREFYGKVFSFAEKSGAASGVVAFQIGAGQFVEFTASRSDESADPLELVFFGVSEKPTKPLTDQDARRVEFVANAAQSAPRKTGPHDISHHLLHLGIGTTDLNRAISFYGEHFGCKESWRGPAPAEFRIVILRVPGRQEEFVEFLLRGEQGSPDHLCFDVPDIQRAYEMLIERGATTRGKPRIASNGHWVLNLVDPNGLRVELMEPRPAAK